MWIEMVLVLEAPQRFFTRYYCFFKSASFADNKELNETLRKQIPDGLIPTMCVVRKFTKFFEISFINEERQVAALNRPFHLQCRAIVVSPTLDSGTRIVFQARRESYTPAASTEREDRETPCRVQGRPNGPPPTSTFHPFAALEFAKGSQGTQVEEGNAVSSAATQQQQDNVTASFAASTSSFQSEETPAITASTDGEAVSATSDGQISTDLGQHGAQTDGTEPSILEIQLLIYFEHCWILLCARPFQKKK
ncbi:hypothetical protein [Parasitella parasitica]|uniref:Uncharacterized protein n=1 Tax=Parasitella parasitica TaxID=35722 RepID=A0A0B7NGS7_9FUNG|nr:hypothetical protein [Parasitella parasitica]